MRLTNSEGLQIRKLDLALKRQLLHECVDRNYSMEMLLRHMWEAYAREQGYPVAEMATAERAA